MVISDMGSVLRVLFALDCHVKRCPQRQESRVERLKARVEPLST